MVKNCVVPTSMLGGKLDNVMLPEKEKENEQEEKKKQSAVARTASQNRKMGGR